MRRSAGELVVNLRRCLARLVYRGRATMMHVQPFTVRRVPMSTAQITIYSTAVCPYCMAAKNFLKSKGQTWTEVRIDTDPAEREKMMARTRRTSVPQIFIGDTHVGGYDDLMALHRAGGLEPLLNGDTA
jgi:glutaredoxin 3